MPIDSNFLQQITGGAGNNGGQGGGQQGGGNQGGGQQQPFYGQGYQSNLGQNFSWQNFVNQYNQVQQANQQRADEEQRSAFDRDAPDGYRRMNDVDRFFGGLNQITQTLSTGASEALGMGQLDLDEGFTPENIARFAVNLPGQLLSSPFDLATHAAEAITGTPFTEANLDTGYIPNEQLDANQRLASLGYAGLDVLGFVPGVGPEAKAVGIAAKAGGAGARAIGKEAAADALSTAGEATAKGLIKQSRTFETAATAAGASDGVVRAAKIGDTVADIATSSAFEGAQEAGQTLLEDIRYKQFNDQSWERAAQAGAWGALGGGMVSGAGNFATRGGEALSSDPVTDPNQNTSMTFEREKERNQTQMSGALTNSAAKRLAELSRDHNEIPGSTSALSTVIDRSYRLTQCGLGENAIHAMLQADDNGASVKAIADRFHSTPEEILRIDARENAADRAQLYNDLIARARSQGKPVNVVIGRNPDTGLGTALFDLKGVFVGDGLHMNRKAYMMYGGDVDGDKNQVHFGSGAQHNGYLTKNLVSSATGLSRLNEDYMQFGDTDEVLKRLDDDIDVMLSQYPSLNADNIKKAYRECFNDGKADVDKISHFFDSLRSMLYRAEHAKRQAAGGEIDANMVSYAVDNAVAELMYDVESQAVIMPQKFADVANKLTYEEQQAADALYRVMANAGDRYLRSGTTAGGSHFAEFAAQLGYKIAANTNLGNPFFRQAGQVYYHAQKDQNMWFGGLDKTQLRNVYDQLIAFSFRLSEIGGDVENSIEGIWRTTVQDEVMQRLFANGFIKVDTKGGWDEFINTFIEVHDEYVGTFNRSLEVPTTRSGDRSVLDSARKKTLASADEKVRNRAIARAFTEVFGEYYFNDIFDIPDTHPMYGKTINQGVEEYAVHAGRWNGMFSNYAGFGSFWKTLLEDYGGKQNAIGTRVENEIELMASKIRIVGNHATKEIVNGKETWSIDPDYMDVMSEFIDAWNMLLSPDSSMRLSLATVDSFINTEWGRAMISGDEYRMKNAYVSALLTDQYETVIDIATQHDVANEPEWLNKLKIEASQLADNSPLHMAIYVDLDKNNSLSMLQYFTDLDKTFENKTVMFNRFMADNYGNNGLIASALHSTDSEMSISAVSKRLKQVDRTVTRAMRKSREYNLQVIQHIEDSINQGRYTVDDAVAAMREFSKQEYVEFSTDAIASFAYSQRDIVKEMVEKGTTSRSSDMVYQQAAQVWQGGNLSYIDQLGVELGNMSIGNFQTNRVQILRILNDPEAQIRLWDPTQDGFIMLTQKSMFAEFGIDIDDSGPTASQFLAFLREVPQIASIIAPTKLDVVSDNSNTVLTAGTSTRLDSAIQQWKNRGNRVTRQMSEKANRNKIKQMMFQDPDWWGMLIASTENIGENLTLEQTKQKVEEAVERHVDFFMEYARMSDGQNYQDAKQAYFSDMYTSLLENASDLMNDIDMVRKYMSITGSTASAMANDAAFSSLSLYKLTAVSKLFEDNGVDFDTSNVLFLETDNYKVNAIPDILRENGQTFLDLSFALMNMADTSDLSFDSYLRAGRFDTAIDEQISQLEQTDPDKAQSIRDEIDSWGNGLQGFVKYITGSEKIELSGLVSDLVITDDAIASNGNPGWTAQQWVDRCHDIMDACGRLDDFGGKDEKSILDAAAKNDMSKIKSYYNNIIVEKLLGDLTFGSGKTVNLDAMQQTMDARKHMIDMADRIKGQLKADGIVLEERDASAAKNIKLPRIDFNYMDTTVAYMSTSGVMNAQGGSVGSGIGVDGVMTKLIAAFGALPPDSDCGVHGDLIDVSEVTDDMIGWNYRDMNGNLHRLRDSNDLLRLKRSGFPQVTVYDPSKCLSWTCSKCGRASESASNPRYNMVSTGLAELANWMQENRHLQAKKTVGFAGLISEGIDPRSDLMAPIEFKLGDGTDVADGVRVGLLDALYSRRVELANFWNDKFVATDGSLPLDMDYAIAFSNATTPVIEVMTNDNQVVYVSVHDLVDAATFAAKYPELAQGNIATSRPVIMSLQEVSSKIIRGLCRNYYSPVNMSKFSKQDVHESAQRAFEDWSSYNTSKVDLSSVLSGIVSYSPSFTSGMAADVTPSAKLRWNEQDYHAISRLFKGDKWETKLPSDRASRAIEDAASRMDQIGFPSKYVVARYSTDGSKIVTGMHQFFRNIMFNEGEDGNQNMFKVDGKTRIAVELFDCDTYHVNSSTISAARDAYDRAVDNGRAFIMPLRVFDRMDNVLSEDVCASAIHFQIQKLDYVLIDPDINDLIAYYRGTNMQMATDEISPDEITIAVGVKDRLELPDGAHYTRRDYQPMYTSRGNDKFKASSLLGGINPITLVTDYNEIASISKDQIDYKFYEDMPNRPDMRVYQGAVDNFIKAAAHRTGSARTQTNVSRESCIGFVKQQQGTETVYAPLFYTGSIPETATTVNVRLNRGMVDITFTTDMIDYNGNESMKLDLYGVAYKSVGHKVSQEMQDQYWSALDDCGFNVVNSPEHMFDYHALSSRVFNMSDSIVQNNLFYFSRKVGVNLFFDIDSQGQITRKKGLNPEITDAELSDLANGSARAWNKVANGETMLFVDINGDESLTIEMNEILKNLTKEIRLDGGFPHLFFNSRQISWRDGQWVDEGIWPRDMTFRMATKYLNRDKTLKLFHLLDRRLCPNGWEAGANDSMDTVFDRSGRMIDRNTLSGEPERVYTLVGPHYYTGQGTAIGNLSRTAAYSNQHMIKRLMELGVYPKQINDLISFLGMQTGDISEYVETASERLARHDFTRKQRTVNRDLYDKVAMSVGDPVYTYKADRYRQTLASMLEETTRRLPVTMEDLKTDAFTDAIARSQIDDAIASLNKACGNPHPSVMLTRDQVLELVRYEVGFTENNGRGLANGLTYNQVLNSIERMKQNVQDGGLLIKGGKFQGALGDVRMHIPLLPKGLSARLFALPKINSYYKGDLNAFIEDQIDELKTVTMPAIETIEDEAKKKSLYRFCDAVCYANGKDLVSGHILDDIYMPDLMKAIEEWGGRLEGYDPDFVAKYKELSQLNVEYINKLNKLNTSRKSSVIENADGGRTIVFHGDKRTVGTYILRSLSSLRKMMGMSYAFMLPANVTERFVNQGMQSAALTLGQAKIGPYVGGRVDPKVAKEAVKNADFKKLYIALRSAELVGSDRELLVQIRNGQDIDTAIENVLRSKGAFERFQEKFMNVMSGFDIGIEGQMRNFIDRFAQRATKEAPWWNMKAEGSERSILDQQLEEDPAKWFINVLNGSSTSPGADMLLARQCLNWAKRGDMAQKNLVSAIYSEIASRHAGFEFFTTAFVSPYFQYATNRIGRIMNWVTPICSIHYVVTDFMTKGPGKNIPIGSDMTFGDLALEDVQFQANLKEACLIDILHLGPQMVALILIGMAGAIEPPDDEDKWGNFKEWTIFGQRVDVAWWLEDILGLALPVAVFGKSAQLGKPRLDIITNGIAYYLSNNPVTKVADAISILLDPMSELQKDYDKNLEGYAKAMSGPPQMTDILNGKLTSFGLSFVSQFITPGVLREIYNGSIDFEPTYKRVFETDATGRLTEEGMFDNKTQYTTYQDAVVRKFTKDNPVMGWLADLVMQPQTGYMAHEMPDRIVYDPEQMNSMEAFSLYNDPWTKKDPKSEQEQLATCLAVVATLQSESVEQLYREGFLIDYDTKVYVGKWLWDQIASLNEQWAEMEQSGALDYYVAGNGNYAEGQRIVSELKQQHYGMIDEIKSLYYDKLWADELKSPAQYNQLHTKWAQDDNGEWYATGYYPSWFLPVTIAPNETQGGYQYVMSRENDWQTESIVTGDATGQRGLVPREIGKITTPDIQSWSSDGTKTGHSDIYGNGNGTGNGSDKNGSSTTTSKSGYPRGGYSRRYYGGGGGYRRRGGGGGGGGGGRGGYTPNAYGPSVSLSKTNVSRIMNTDRIINPNEVYLRPDFETKGSREAYKRSDI